MTTKSKDEETKLTRDPQTSQGPPKPITITALCNKTDKWEGARVVEGKFKRAFFGDKLKPLVDDILGPTLTRKYPDGTEVTVNVQIDLPEKDEDKQDGQEDE